MTPTQAGDLVTPPQGAAPSTHHQRIAHQIPFNLDDASHGLGAVHIHFNDLGELYDPTTPEGQAPPLIVGPARLLRG